MECAMKMERGRKEGRKEGRKGVMEWRRRGSEREDFCITCKEKSGRY